MLKYYYCNNLFLLCVLIHAFQVISDADNSISRVDEYFPGSVHDAFVFNSSPVGVEGTQGYFCDFPVLG